MKMYWATCPDSLRASVVVSYSKTVARPYRRQIGNALRLDLPWKDGKSHATDLKNKMNEELEQKLLEDFPALFLDKEEEPCLRWGIECGDGWEPLIRGVCESIENQGSFIAQIKEPFVGAYKLDVIAHNLARKVEKMCKLQNYTLYSTKLNRRYAAFPGFRTKFRQIKEKFGALRIYYDIVNNFQSVDIAQFNQDFISTERTRYNGWISGIVDFAEALSSKTCENDGSCGTLYSKGWWKTLCPDCAVKAEKL